MMIAKMQCLYVFVLLYGGAILAVFVRAFPRRRLLAEHEKLLAGQPHGEPESTVKRLLLAIPRQSRALKKMGESIGSAPATVRHQYRLFQILNWIALILIVLLVIFSVGAHRVCEA